MCLHSDARTAWAMTERNGAALERGPEFLRIGPSELHWRGDTLVIRLRERGFPWPARIRGEIRLRPQITTQARFTLDAPGQHWWSPLAPQAQVDVDLEHPQQRWCGSGYLDTNGGDVALEQSFRGWHWLRTNVGARAAVLYDVEPLQGAPLALALAFAADGSIEPFVPPPRRRLGASLWRVERITRGEDSAPTTLTRTLVDAPFYARNVVTTQILGQPAIGIHESLSLERFRSPLVQAMLAFRMPRRSGPHLRHAGDDPDSTPPVR